MGRRIAIGKQLDPTTSDAPPPRRSRAASQDRSSGGRERSRDGVPRARRSTSNRERTAPQSQRLGNMAAMMRVIRRFQTPIGEPVERKRYLVAEMCRLMGAQLLQEAAPTAPSAMPEAKSPVAVATTPAQPDGVPLKADAGPSLPPLSPRMRQTLGRLLAGDSEKEIAGRLQLSPHTIHVYIKSLYRRFAVCSRGELLARFVRPSDSE